MNDWAHRQAEEIAEGNCFILIDRIAAALREARAGSGPAPDIAHHTARFELRRDEDTGRLYWWGAEDGWKDATEIGEDAVLTLNGANFQVGTILRLSEPFDG